MANTSHLACVDSASELPRCSRGGWTLLVPRSEKISNTTAANEQHMQNGTQIDNVCCASAAVVGRQPYRLNHFAVWCIYLMDGVAGFSLVFAFVTLREAMCRHLRANSF